MRSLTLEVVPLASAFRSPLLSLFVAVPSGEAQLEATVELGSEVYDLRFYGSDEMLVPAWWIGVFDSSGELRKTAVSPRPDLSPIDLTLWLRPIVGWLMPRVGPRGREFARARVEMKALETVVHLRREEPRRMKTMVPEHVWAIVKPYGVAARPGEREAPEKGP